MKTRKNLTAGDWIEGPALIADIRGGHVDVVALDEGDSAEMALKQAMRLRLINRQRRTQTRWRERLRAAVGRFH